MSFNKKLKVLHPAGGAPIEAGRICWSCTHIYFDQATPGYSEYTPGSDFGLTCSKDVWEFDSLSDNLKTFREMLKSAERCPWFEPHPEGSYRA